MAHRSTKFDAFPVPLKNIAEAAAAIQYHIGIFRSNRREIFSFHSMNTEGLPYYSHHIAKELFIELSVQLDLTVTGDLHPRHCERFDLRCLKINFDERGLRLRTLRSSVSASQRLIHVAPIEAPRSSRLCARLPRCNKLPPLVGASVDKFSSFRPWLHSMPAAY